MGTGVEEEEMVFPSGLLGLTSILLSGPVMVFSTFGLSL